jgi:hypothetical protein
MMDTDISKMILTKNMKEMKNNPHKMMIKNKKILMKMRRKRKKRV